MSMLARVVWSAALLLLSGPAFAVPMDLRDLRERWVVVEFEVSPPNKPYQLRTIYTEPIRAWFEPASEPGRVRVTIDGGIVERQLMRGEKPKPGSFSDFVWVFDVETGRVVSATLSGTLSRTLHWGLGRGDVEAKISAEMASDAVAGFKPPLRLLGNVLHRFCRDPENRRCTLVEGRSYDFGSGYVNAVGRMRVGSKLSATGVFSPLGEAVFSEIEGADASDATTPLTPPPPPALATPEAASQWSLAAGREAPGL